METLYVIRGVSGSGKSTFAKKLAEALQICYFEADMYHYDEEGNYNWKPSTVAASHAWCRNMVIEELGKGKSVIVANTTTTEKELAPYLAIAEEMCCNVVSLIVENRHGNDSIHDVPQEIRERQAQRLRGSIKLI